MCYMIYRISFIYVELIFTLHFSGYQPDYIKKSRVQLTWLSNARG